MSDFDFSAFEKFEQRLKKLDEKQLTSVNKKSVDLIGKYYLSNVVQLTPVGLYDPKSGKVGGTLRRGWKLDGLAKKRGKDYELDVINPTDYASFVNFGHRTRGHKGWVEGQFFAERASEQTIKEVQQPLEKLVARELRRHLDAN